MAIFIYVRSQKVFNPYLWLSTCSRSSGFLWDRTCLRVGSAWWDPGCPVFCNMFPSCGCCEGSVLSLFTGSVCITWCSLGDNILVGDNANRYHLRELPSCVSTEIGKLVLSIAKEKTSFHIEYNLSELQCIQYVQLLLLLPCPVRTLEKHKQPIILRCRTVGFFLSSFS